MSQRNARSKWLWISAVTLVVVAGLSVIMSGQQGRLADSRNSLDVPILTHGPAPMEFVGLPDDWTHHHLIFSNPGTEEEATKNGRHEEWLRIVNDPRYVMQQLKRRSPAQGPAAEYVARIIESAQARDADEGGEGTVPEFAFPIHAVGPAPGRQARPVIHRDWSMDLGSGAKVGAGMFPAKFSFNPIGAANCISSGTPDFVVYNTSVAGSSSQASIVGYDNLYSSCSGQVPSVYWAYNTGGTVQTSVVLSSDGTQVAFVQTPGSGNAQLAILKWESPSTGRNLTSGGTNISSGSKTFTVTSGLTSLDVGAGISGTGIPASDTIATVTSATAGTLFTAATGNGTSGEILAITADAGGPDSLTAVSTSSYRSCSKPCMTTISFSGTSRSDTISSPYYDYGSDTLYVGDASGGLHKFTGVFNGTPGESGSPWASPSTTALSSPVYNGTDVFVGDASGFLYSVDSTPTVTKSVQLATSPGIVDGPLVDETNGQVWVFVSADMNDSSGVDSACNTKAAPLACNGAIQLPTSFNGTTDFSESVMGVNTTNTLYAGAFDNLYQTSSGNGNLYAVAATGTNAPKLSEIPLTSAALSTETSNCESGYTKPPNCSTEYCSLNIQNPLTSAAANGSPVTEILNGSTDYIFLSVSGSSSLSTTGCASGNGCIYSWTVTTALSPGASPTDGLLATSGTSGIIIDNTSSTGGASQVYDSTLGNDTCTTSGTLDSGGCAVQASQSALQ